MKTNLLKETKEDMKRLGVSIKSVVAVYADSFGQFSWDEFAEIAKDTVYDAGYGGQEIAKDLVILGDTWWMERGEYDGSEWWDFHRYPDISELPVRCPKTLNRGYWHELADMNKEVES